MNEAPKELWKGGQWASYSTQRYPLSGLAIAHSSNQPDTPITKLQSQRRRRCRNNYNHFAQRSQPFSFSLTFNTSTTSCNITHSSSWRTASRLWTTSTPVVRHGSCLCPCIASPFANSRLFQLRLMSRTSLHQQMTSSPANKLFSVTTPPSSLPAMTRLHL